MNQAKTKLLLILIVFGLVSASLGIWVYFSVDKDINSQDLILIGPVILVLILTIPVILRSYKSVKEKMPLEDERTNKAKMKAASLTFYISIYLLLAIGWFGEGFFEKPSQATGAGIMGMAIIFLLTWLYFEKSAKL